MRWPRRPEAVFTRPASRSRRHQIPARGVNGRRPPALSGSNRIPSSNPALLILIATALVGVASTCQEHAFERHGAPPLPDLQLDGMAPDAGAALSQAQQRAIGNPHDAESNGALGTVLHAYGLRDESIQCYRRAAAFAPKDWRWPHYLGIAHAELGHHREAAGYFRAASALQPSSVAARVRLGNSLLADDRAGESRQVFEDSVDLNPSSAPSHYGLGRAYEAEGDSSAALRSYLRAVDLAPEAGAVRYSLAMLYGTLGRRADASRQLELMGEGDRIEPRLDDPLMAALNGIRTDKHALLQDGLRLEGAGSLLEAVRAYEMAVELDGTYPQPRINLVAAYGKLKRFEEAAAQYERARELAPDSEELHVNWGTLLIELDRLPEAAGSFRRALEINPHSADTHADLGVVLERVGRAIEAENHFLLALEQDPGHRSANFHIARHRIADNRLAEAIQHLLKTIEPVDNRTPTYLYGLADAYVRSGDLDRAAAHLRRALELAMRLEQPELAREIRHDLQALEASRARQAN